MTWKKILAVIIGSLLISFLSYYLFNRYSRSNSESLPAALHVESLSKPLTVILDNKILGKTPFNSESLKEGESSFILSSEESSFRTKINLTGGAITVVGWGLGPSEIFSEGEIIWLEKVKSGAALVVFGSPEDAELRLDDQLLGTAPISTEKVSQGDHSLKVSKQGYKSRTIRLKIQEGYKLSIKFQLFLIPGTVEAPTIPFPEEPRYRLKDFSTNYPFLYSDTKGWLRGLIYFFDSPEASISAEKRPDFYFDYDGLIFDQSGFKVANGSEVTPKDRLVLGYLGRRSDGGISREAKKSLLGFAAKGLVSQQLVEILSTGTGWLRVRSSPSLSADEVAKVNVGEKIILLEDQGSWYEVKLADGKTGWVSSSFAKKL